MTNAKEQNLSKKVFTIEDYAQSGLIAQWDGFFYTGTQWKDIVGGRVFNFKQQYEVNAGHILFPAEHPMMSCALSLGMFQDRTIEVVARCLDISKSEQQCVSLFEDGNGDSVMFTDNVNSGLCFSTRRALLTAYRTNTSILASSLFSAAITRDYAQTQATFYANGKRVVTRSDASYQQPVERVDIRNNKLVAKEFCAIRVYNRALDVLEIESNFKVDKVRFGI